MKTEHAIAEVNIHLRARTLDRALIDQAAELSGSNRSQFMLTAAIREAKNVLLDQTTLHVDQLSFNRVLESLDAPLTEEQAVGMKRLRSARRPWPNE